MANTFYAIGSYIGAKLSDTETVAKHATGTVVNGNNGSKWMYVFAGSAIAAYDCVAIQASNTAAPITHALARAGNTVGIAQNAIAASDSGWVALEGQNLIVNTLAAEGVGVTLYTTDTAGALADATASGSAATLFGLTLVATASGTTASSAACIAHNIVVRKTIVDS